MKVGDLVIKIVVQGKEAKAQISGIGGEMKEASGTVEKAGSRMRNTFSSIGSIAQKTWFTIQTVGMAVQGLNRLSDAANELEKAERRLEGASKLTGVSLDDMRANAVKAREDLGLTTKQSNLITESLTKLGSKAGDLDSVSSATGRLLDLAAARGYDAEQALVAIDQAILGIDEGTDKLFGKNPSVIYKEYADAVGLSVGKMTDQQKAQALLNAVMEDGLKVQGSYEDFLKSSAGRQSLAAAKAEEAAAKFGMLYNEIKNIVFEVATPILEFFAGMDTSTLKLITTLTGVIALLVKLPAILGGVSTALKAVGISANLAMGPIGLVIGIIGTLAAVWVSNIGGIQEKTKTGIQYVIAAFKAWWEFLKDIGNRIKEYMGGLGGLIASAVRFDIDGIKANAAQMRDAVIGGWDDTLGKIKDKFTQHVEDYKQKNQDKLQNELETQQKIVAAQAGGGGGAEAAPETRELDLSNAPEIRMRQQKHEMIQAMTDEHHQIMLQKENEFQNVVGAGYDQLWNSLASKQLTFGQRLQGAWNAMKEQFMQFLGAKVKAVVFAEKTQTRVERTEQGKRLATQRGNLMQEAFMLAKSIGKNLATMAARLYAGFAKMGPIGFLAGIGAVAGAIALVKNIVQGLDKVVGFEKGGLLEPGKPGYFEGTGPEIVAPQKDFIAVVKAMRQQGAFEVAGAAAPNQGELIKEVRALRDALRVELYTNDTLIAESANRGNRYKERISI